jgi:hypothetical protein
LVTFGETGIVGKGEIGVFGVVGTIGVAVTAGGVVVFGVMVTFGETVMAGVAVAFGFVFAQALNSDSTNMTARIYRMTLFNALPPIEIQYTLILLLFAKIL